MNFSHYPPLESLTNACELVLLLLAKYPVRGSVTNTT